MGSPVKPFNIVIIGAGNTATHFASALLKSRFKINQIFSRTKKSARALSAKIGCDYTTTIENIDKTADLYLFCLKDDVLGEIATKIKLPGKIVCHCSGSMDISILKEISNYVGVLYPLQTLNKNMKVNFSEIPLCVEASDKKTKKLLGDLAAKLSYRVYFLSSEKRLMLHIAAVFCSNFTNHLYKISREVCVKNNIPFEILAPLIKQTSENGSATDPGLFQTGPAIRRDSKIIDIHLKQLATTPEAKKIYKLLTDSIIGHHYGKKEL